MSGTKKTPERMCIACRKMHDKSDLLRLVRQEDRVYLDVTGKAQGRGAYVCRNKACIDKAIDKGAIRHHFKAGPAEDLKTALYNEVDAKALRLIGMANRAGQVTAGMNAVVRDLSQGKIKLLVVSEDIGDNSLKKIEHASEDQEVPLITLGTSQSLGNYTGAEKRSIVGIKDNNFAQAITGLLVV